MLDFLTGLDQRIFIAIHHQFSHPLADSFFLWVTDLHRTIYFKLVLIPIAIFLFVRSYKREGLILFFILALGLGINDFVGGKIKHAVNRERPYENAEVSAVAKSPAGGHSFPSNHASNMFTFATYTAQLIPAAGVPLYIIAGTVAYSRVYNGVHYPSDVLAGSLFGYLWGFFLSNVAKKILQKIRNRKKAE